jgi:hypothetical protein
MNADEAREESPVSRAVAKEAAQSKTMLERRGQRQKGCRCSAKSCCGVGQKMKMLQCRDDYAWKFCPEVSIVYESDVNSMARATYWTLDWTDC